MADFSEINKRVGLNKHSCVGRIFSHLCRWKSDLKEKSQNLIKWVVVPKNPNLRISPSIFAYFYLSELYYFVHLAMADPKHNFSGNSCGRSPRQNKSWLAWLYTPRKKLCRNRQVLNWFNIFYTHHTWVVFWNPSLN